MHYTLTLTFDADDTIAPLTVAMTSEVGGPPMTIEGSAYLLQRDDTIAVNVAVVSSGALPSQVRVSSLVLAASPGGKKNGKYLSPFNKFDACASLKEWGLPSAASVSDMQEISVTPVLHPLAVAAKRGRWSLAGNLSVLISKTKKSGETKVRPRLYKFKLGLAIGA